MGARVGSPAFSQPASQAGTGSVLHAGAQGGWFVPGHCWAAVVEGSVTALSKAVGIPVKCGGEESASVQPRFPLPSSWSLCCPPCGMQPTLDPAPALVVGGERQLEWLFRKQNYSKTWEVPTSHL